MGKPGAVLALSLDTTTRAGSLALTRGEETIALVTGDPARTHGERLPGEIDALLKQGRVGIRDVTVYGVAAGPGSFTGLRVGIAAIQGLALATGRQVVPIGTLDALAAVPHPELSPGDTTATWMDAQRGQVFAALYAAGRLLRRAVSLPPEDVLDQWRREPSLAGGTPVFIGDGAVTYRDAIGRVFSRARILAPPPLAPIVGRLAVARIADAVPPHAIVPIYVRPPDAELARERLKPPARTPSR